MWWEKRRKLQQLNMIIENQNHELHNRIRKEKGIYDKLLDGGCKRIQDCCFLRWRKDANIYYLL
jgi:hypothetical protein